MSSVDYRYLETKILTASPEELTLIIFDVLILASTKAAEKLRTDVNDIQAIHDELRRGQRALALLMGSLDFEIGGDLARSLFKVYAWWHKELVLANMQKAAERVEKLIPDFKSYRATWAEANKRHRAEMQSVPRKEMVGSFVAVG